MSYTTNIFEINLSQDVLRLGLSFDSGVGLNLGL